MTRSVIFIPLTLIIAIIFFLPFPYYQREQVVCKMGQTCPIPGWHTRKSLFQEIISMFSNSATTGSTRLNDFQCPANGWVGCMPILSEEGKRACSPEAMAWYKANCPNFQGAAL